ncbi:hypothetical protein QYM36_001099 [Artemia franciscana]|uniref:DNA polymerase subunit gamma-1 n=1 Tax=Artemia franciscana TaxID=6661 RepID=A0AA88LHT5_ARTSF|nr:hypothetical protein QYM36_001099 [Artemia franciscana]
MMNLMKFLTNNFSVCASLRRDVLDLPFEPRCVLSYRSPLTIASEKISNDLKQNDNERKTDRRSNNKDEHEHFKTTVQAQAKNVNVCGIQMLSEDVRKAIFLDKKKENDDPQVLEKVKNHLLAHNLWNRFSDILPEVKLKLPKMEGPDIDSHFQRIALLQVSSYIHLLKNFVKTEPINLPHKWEFKPGWTKYNYDGSTKAVIYPEEDVYVFDVEVCVSEGKAPTLAVALSEASIYLWCSENLVNSQTNLSKNHYSLDDMIPIESQHGKIEKKERLIIGHNVGFDRARIREQYLLENTKTRFLDTMSLHVAVGGVTSYQRNVMMVASNGGEVKKGKDNSVLDWLLVSSRNGLSDVHELYCGNRLNKEARDLFVKGSMADIRENFQALATYCADDCLATLRVLKELLPLYLERFPHPVTFAGMLEMGTSILPVNSNWDRYLESAEASFLETETILSRGLAQQAEDAVKYMNDSQYKEDPWLWNLDWSTQELKVKKTKPRKKAIDKRVDTYGPFTFEYNNEVYESVGILSERYGDLMNAEEKLYKRVPFLPGYPQWFRDLCTKSETEEGFIYGPYDMSTSLQVVPKILKLTWCGYPLHYVKEFGWGYLIPGRPLENSKCISENGESFPLDAALKMFPPGQVPLGHGHDLRVEEMLAALKNVTAGRVEGETAKATWEELKATMSLPIFAPKEKKNLTVDKPDYHEGIGPYDVGIPGCWFFKLPHKDSGDRNVGNPLAKDYVSYIENGLLKSQVSGLAQKLLKTSKAVNFWKMYRDRILNQLVVFMDKTNLPRFVQKADTFDGGQQYGAILPMTVVAGTLTRRAVESTWMTASNAYKDRIGSEMKSMVQAPPGYHFVGADVDSQELWISSVIGDAHFAGEHGATAFGWMTLQGKKSDGTDMHSRTAAMTSTTRDQAKVLNYGRIYGAGENFAKSLLKQFNSKLSDEEALEKAKHIYTETKGTRILILNENGKLLLTAAGMDPAIPVTWEDLRKVKADVRKRINEGSLPIENIDLLSCKIKDMVEKRAWHGGTESHMFNKLEEIVGEPEPKTPVLGCRITRALDPCNVGESVRLELCWASNTLVLSCFFSLAPRFQLNSRKC